MRTVTDSLPLALPVSFTTRVHSLWSSYRKTVQNKKHAV